MSNIYWVVTMTFLSMCTCVITKMRRYLSNRYKKV
ncbi:DUF2651 family protein [Bacillus sp. 179-C3.3 HS]